MTASRSSEKGGRFAGGHFAGGHDGMANLCKPIMAYDFHMRYNNTYSLTLYTAGIYMVSVYKRIYNKAYSALTTHMTNDSIRHIYDCSGFIKVSILCYVINVLSIPNISFMY